MSDPTFYSNVIPGNTAIKGLNRHNVYTSCMYTHTPMYANGMQMGYTYVCVCMYEVVHVRSYILVCTV